MPLFAPSEGFSLLFLCLPDEPSFQLPTMPNTSSRWCSMLHNSPSIGGTQNVRPSSSVIRPSRSACNCASPFNWAARAFLEAALLVGVICSIRNILRRSKSALFADAPSVGYYASRPLGKSEQFLLIFCNFIVLILKSCSAISQRTGELVRIVAGVPAAATEVAAQNEERLQVVISAHLKIQGFV